MYCQSKPNIGLMILNNTFAKTSFMSSLTISTIQSDLFWEDKEANLGMFEKKIRAISEKTEIIILPEMFSTGFSMNAEKFAEKMDGRTISWMKDISKEKRAIITGSLIIEEENKFYNRLVWMMPNGNFGYYDKRHLFAYAEEDKYYTCGNKRLIASVNGWKINLQICYDLRFPVWARQQSDAEYDLLIYVANWPSRRSQAWKALLQARAIENQCYVIGVNRVGKDGNDILYSGDSLIIDPLGETIHDMKDEDTVFGFTLEKQKLNEIRTKFPFLRDADDFSIHKMF
jgi:predicted amidohydrolase